MRKIILPMFVFFGILFSCKREDKSSITNLTEIKADSVAGMPIDTVNTSDNSETSLDWEGVYVGVIPCANCEGIEVELTLVKDKTFVLKTKYIGKGDGKIITEKGIFSWNESGSVIKLNGLEQKPNKYKVGENHLVQMDMNGNIIEGSLASKYILKKK
jgi:uncharacterized lipoprotein NlpE involved in copper resistance